MQNKKKNIYTILTVIFLLIFVASIGVIVRNSYVQNKADDLYEQMAENATITTEETETTNLDETTDQDQAQTQEQPQDETNEQTQEQTTEEETDILEQLDITVPARTLDWDELHEQNEDIYAWIYIPNTNIDYPILQHPTDLNYYIDYNIDGTKGYPGCICTQYYNSKDFNDPNTIVYGHNMKNGTMFRTLHNYEDEEFFNDNPYVYIFTPETTYVYEIFAACTVSDEHLMYAYDFWKYGDYNSFISDICNSRAMTNQVREGSEAVYGDYLLTLSTCVSGQSNKRWIVVGKRLN
jgi:sortase B